jgi:AcrR family transcriptional regulator
MKTRDRILEVALELFNTEGVGGQSALDIASAMGISAGHLYYHFKGKPEILGHLLARHREEIDLVTKALTEAATEPSLESLWTHVHILVEETWDARFFWREIALAEGHEDLSAHARHVLVAIRQAMAQMLDALAQAEIVKASAETRDGLARQMATGVVFQTHALALEFQDEPPRERIARAAAQIMIPVAGFSAA